MPLLDRLFGKRAGPLGDFAFLGSDMHSHLIPGIDDGAPDLETAVSLVRELHKMGYRHLVTTPHVMADLYPNSTQVIQEGVRTLRAGVRQAGIDITLAAAAEYLLDEGFSARLEVKDLLTLTGQEVLVEMGFIAPPPNLYDLLFRLQTAGYVPILAHPERYEFYRGDLAAFERLVTAGCRFQLNLLSLTGYYGRSVKQTAKQLLANGWVRYLGTDLHHERHAQQLTKLLQDREIGRLLANYQFNNHNLKA